MYDDLDGKTTVDETPPFQPRSIAPLAMDVTPPLSIQDRSASFSWPPPPPAKTSSTAIWIASGLSLLGVLGLVASFAFAETSPAPATVVMPRTAKIVEAKTISYASGVAVAR